MYVYAYRLNDYRFGGRPFMVLPQNKPFYASTWPPTRPVANARLGEPSRILTSSPRL